jgi:hypothetical protein
MEDGTSTESRRRVHKLPPELFEFIYDSTFTPTSSIIKIDKDYKPPSNLQVNRELRAQLVDAFYNANTLYIFQDTELLEKWLESLIKHRNFRKLGTIYFDTGTSTPIAYMDELFTPYTLQKIAVRHILERLRVRARA